MKVLVACEFSGIVRDAFRRRGHDVWSCDLLPTERPGPHIEGDVLPHLADGWDLLIAHPPCTYLTNAGARWLFEKPGRWAQMEDAARFFNVLRQAPVPRIAVENPWPHTWAAKIIGWPDQRLQPWHFGHREKKGVCWWLKNLPPLLPTAIVGPPPKAGTEEAKAWEKVWREPPGPNQAKNRSRSYEGMAEAMADQWGIP